MGGVGRGVSLWARAEPPYADDGTCPLLTERSCLQEREGGTDVGQGGKVLSSYPLGFRHAGVFLEMLPVPVGEGWGPQCAPH